MNLEGVVGGVRVALDWEDVGVLAFLISKGFSCK